MTQFMLCLTALIRKYFRTFATGAVFMIIVFPVSAETGISILEFELKDLTLQPRLEEEKERAASIRPMLEEMLQSGGGFRIVPIDVEDQRAADQATGYLYDHHDVVAGLGRKYGAERVLVGRVHKASHLFVYFLAHLVDTGSGQVVAEYVVEVKGPQIKLTRKGVESLARQIRETVLARQTAD